MSKSKCLNQVGGMVIATFTHDQAAKDFRKWFKKSMYVEQFEMSIEVDEELGELLTIAAYNPFFNIDALQEVYNIELSKAQIQEFNKTTNDRNH